MSILLLYIEKEPSVVIGKCRTQVPFSFFSCGWCWTVSTGGDSWGGQGSICFAEVTCSSCWSHPSLYHISKKGWWIFLMPRGFAYWLYKLSGGLKTGQPTASMPKPERGQVLTAWLKARTSSQSILKEANTRCSCSQLWVPLNYEQNQELLLCMQITWSAPPWLLDRNHHSVCVGIPRLLILGRKKYTVAAPWVSMPPDVLQVPKKKGLSGLEAQPKGRYGTKGCICSPWAGFRVKPLP